MPRPLHKGVRSLAPTLLVLLLLPLGAAAQDRDVVFNQVTVSSQEAGIDLEFADGGSLTVVFRDGRVLMDGEEVGRYSPGDALERSWRGLLGQAVAADNGGVAALLQGWSPPAGLSGEEVRVSEALADRIATRFASAAGAPETPGLPALSPEAERNLLQRMVLRPERLQALTDMVRQAAGDGIRVHVGETVRVEAGEEVEGSILVVDGNLLLDGRVRGDVLVVDGEVQLGEDARVDGDLHWLDVRILGDRAAVRGEIRELTARAARTEAQLRAELERDLRDSLRDALRAELQPRATPRAARDASRGAFRNILSGIAGLFQTALSFVLITAVGLAVLYFFPRHFETVARTAHESTGRAALVGLAGLVLAFPTWILGIVVLAVTIIGIPVMLLWLPAFPLAVALAMGMGYLAVGWNLGRWVSRRSFQGLEGLDTSRPAAQIGTGVALLLVAFALAHLFKMGGPVLGVVPGLLTAMGVVLSMAAVVVGLGAVILSRAGRDRRFAGIGWSGDEGDDPFGPEPDPFSPGPGPSGPRGPFGPGPTGPWSQGTPGGPAGGGGSPSGEDPWTREPWSGEAGDSGPGGQARPPAPADPAREPEPPATPEAETDGDAGDQGAGPGRETPP